MEKLPHGQLKKLGPGQGSMLPSGTRDLAGGKKRIVIKFMKSFCVSKHLYTLTLSMRELLLMPAFLKEL